MLMLKNIKKDYLAGENTVHALKGIDLKFRNSEFVSILGPSGCGKTTMLNIIGGLDQYTEGDLIINGKSTKDFKNRDWDAYRNHSIGFVFQSYNLIPHQTVLQNVEIALTLSGVSKVQRRALAKKALEDVGLGNQLHKRPSEMSGGQMQRVAIARALVNNPDIILADEPTGALDTETSIQVMDILKEISKDRLIIMVTHNPELAEKYSSRIIKMLDGEIKADSNPLTDKEVTKQAMEDSKNQQRKAGKKVRKPSMSFSTAFMLSLKNLFTKKGRTTLTAFAGSIGIIGIALILAISQGLSGYIDDIQENALSAYPLSIESESVDLSSLMETFMTMGHEKSEHKNDAVYKRSAVYDIINAMSNLDVQENDLKSFKKFIDENRADKTSKFADAVSGIQYSYNLDLQILTKNVDGNIIKSDTLEMMTEILSEFYGADMSAMMGTNQTSTNPLMSMGSSHMAGHSTMWQELLPGENGDPVNKLLKEQYDLVYGSWPNDYNEIVLVLDKNNEIDDVTLYALGLESRETIDAIMQASFNGTPLESDNKKWSYEEICNMEFRTVLNSNCYSYDEASGLYTDLRDSDTGMQYLYDGGIPLKVTGIIKPNEDAEATMLTGSICYTNALTEYVINEAKNADVIKAQLDNPTIDVTNGLPFNENTGILSDEDKMTAFKEYVGKLKDTDKASVYVKMMQIPSDSYLSQSVSQTVSGVSTVQMKEILSQSLTAQMNMSAKDVSDYLQKMSEEDLRALYSKIVSEQIKAQYAASTAQRLAAMTQEQLISALNDYLGKVNASECASYYDNLMEFSENNHEDLLCKMGYIDLDNPSTINLYASSFNAKDTIEDTIADYNKDVDETKQIKYTDYIGIMMSSVSSIIDAITYILIAFVSISLIVSSIMIGVITLISVQERTKEIGILRAIGASKKDVSSMFNAETIIIGFASGLLGVVVTYLLCIPINAVIHDVTGINSLNAFLSIPAAIILILISVFLTLISGLIPSRSAAKKDPVVALRTE